MSPCRPMASGLRVATCALSLCLSACAAIPKLHEGPAPKVDHFDASVLDGGKGDWPNVDWWRQFNDAQLDRLIAEALAGSPNIAMAEARVREASARARLARAEGLPGLDVTGSVTRDKLSYNSIFPTEAVPKGWNDMGHVTLNFDWELDFWGKNRKALDAAVSLNRAAEADMAAARLMLTTAVADGYLRLQLAFDRQDVAAESLKNRRASADLVTRRTQQGLDAPFSLEEATSRVHVAEAQAAESRENVTLAQNALAALLGDGPDRGLHIDRPRIADDTPWAAPAAVQANLLGRKPEVVAARWRVESASSRVGVAKTAFYPDVNLKAFIGLEALGLNRLNDSGSDIGSIGPAFRLPIFEGGRIRSNYRAAGAEYEEAVASYNEALTQALREAADALGGLAAVTDRLTATDAALLRSQNAYRMARARYEGGLSDYQTVLTAEDALLQVRMADTSLHVRGLALDVALVKALGGGYRSPSSLSNRPSP
jgi:NodT family efflux transporter outer membrane factor (OMF) lipoprotein